MERVKRILKSLTMQILLATVAGMIVSTFVGEWSSYLKLAGNLFLRVFQIFVVFYVMATVTGAVLIGDAQDMGRMGIHTFKWIITFTLISAGIGVALSMLIRPGQGLVMTDSMLNMAANLKGEGSVSIDNPVFRMISSLTEGSVVPFIVLAIFFGVAMGAYAKESQNPIVVNWLQKVCIFASKMMEKVIRFVPLGIFCLIANAAANITLDVLVPMGRFLFLLLLGNLIQFAIFVPVTCYLTKTELSKIWKKFLKLSCLALMTTSGAICLLKKNQEEVEKFGISRKVADFTGPITMSMNSCGAVQCYVAAIFFLAQLHQTSLSGYQVLTAVFLSILMCMGTISVPGGSATVYSFLVASLGLSPEGIAILLSIDWISGMLRTLMNVDVDVLVGMLVASRLGELDHEVFQNKKHVTYL